MPNYSKATQFWKFNPCENYTNVTIDDKIPILKTA